MTFILWTLWFTIIAIVVNIVMERLWVRIDTPSFVRERDEEGTIGRHRSK